MVGHKIMEKKIVGKDHRINKLRVYNLTRIHIAKIKVYENTNTQRKTSKKQRASKHPKCSKWKIRLY